MTVRDQIRAEVLSWLGVTEGDHRFGGVEFRLGKREIGHLHGDHLADLPFPGKDPRRARPRRQSAPPPRASTYRLGELSDSRRIRRARRDRTLPDVV
jgi:Luciferase